MRTCGLPLEGPGCEGRTPLPLVFGAGFAFVAFWSSLVCFFLLPEGLGLAFEVELLNSVTSCGRLSVESPDLSVKDGRWVQQQRHQVLASRLCGLQG